MRSPATSTTAPRLPPDGNWLVIGCVARTDLLREVGGFRDFPVYEDWDLWLRCWLAGATFERSRRRLPGARPARLPQPWPLSQEEKHAGPPGIAEANGLPVPA
jgi:hypothetical protein